jgi:hypothetical protein
MESSTSYGIRLFVEIGLLTTIVSVALVFIDHIQGGEGFGLNRNPRKITLPGATG